MKFDQWSVSAKLWGTLGGLLAMMLAVSLWAQFAAARAMDHGMQTLSEYESRISLAIQWKGATETTGERVRASNASTDEELTRLLDGRVKEGSALITKLQAERSEERRVGEECR